MPSDINERTIAEMNVACAHAIFHSFQAAGMQHVVVCPGSRNTPLIVAADAMAGGIIGKHAVGDVGHRWRS